MEFPAHLYPPAGSRPFVLRGRYREDGENTGVRNVDVVSWRVPRGMFFAVTRRTSIVSAISTVSPTPYPLEGGVDVLSGNSVVFRGSADDITGPEWLDETALDHDCSLVFAPDAAVSLRATIITTNSAAATVYASLVGFLTSRDLSYALPR
jgi:hypothetical protein